MVSAIAGAVGGLLNDEENGGSYGFSCLRGPDQRQAPVHGRRRELAAFVDFLSAHLIDPARFPPLPDEEVSDPITEPMVHLHLGSSVVIADEGVEVIDPDGHVRTEHRSGHYEVPKIAEGDVIEIRIITTDEATEPQWENPNDLGGPAIVPMRSDD